MELKYRLNYDYSQTLWMKMFLARPDFPHNCSEVLITFRQALEMIRVIDNLTQGIRKIIYLVGWQGLGHDDCYPEMEEINEFLKETGDASARKALWRLFEEAKRYNTVVSFHGNLADAYSATPCSPELIATDSVLKNADGSPAVIEVFNGRDAYKVSYKGYYESGLFKRNWDRFCAATPVREAGTVHLDNFCIAQNLHPYTSVEEESDARNKMLDYIASLGIDVTTEYTYRELELRADSPEHPIRNYYASQGQPLPDGDWRAAPLRTLGRIPASWWTSNMTAQDCMQIPPAVYSGRLTDPKLLAAFYGAMHGEDIWMDKSIDPRDWGGEFLDQFCTMQLPYFYLNRHERQTLTQTPAGYIVGFSDGIVSDGPKAEITAGGKVLKSGGDVLLPLDRENTVFIAYSRAGKRGMWEIPDAGFEKAALAQITIDGNVPAGEAAIIDGRIALDL
ncbi:MAG: hypothetical protein IKD72_11115 [Clostridia bacterium]|nr:hypothetical protein [Clostridia bacterium]